MKKVNREVLLPDLGEGITKAIIALWCVQPGQDVHVDDDFVEVVTDKASFVIPAPQTGVVQEIRYKEKEEVAVGATLAVIESS